MTHLQYVYIYSSISSALLITQFATIFNSNTSFSLILLVKETAPHEGSASGRPTTNTPIKVSTSLTSAGAKTISRSRSFASYPKGGTLPLEVSLSPL